MNIEEIVARLRQTESRSKRKLLDEAESERPFYDPFQFGSMTTAVIKDGRNDR